MQIQLMENFDFMSEMIKNSLFISPTVNLWLIAQMNLTASMKTSL